MSAVHLIDHSPMKRDPAMRVELSLPRIGPSTVGVEVNEDMLVVKGLRTRQSPEGRLWHAGGISECSFKTRLRLPKTVDAQRSTATYKHGILAIAFPKREKPSRAGLLCQ